jgi:hypothetical protein
MATLTIVLVGIALVAVIIAFEAGVLRLPALRWRRTAGPDATAKVVRCVATTADGDRCVRVPAGRRSRYCWQHERMAQQVRKRGAPMASAGP